MISVDVKVIGADEAVASFKAMPGQMKIAVKKWTGLSGRQVSKFWQLHLSGPAGPRTLGVRSGQLRRSVGIPERIDDETVRVGSNMPYARIHEFGGTIFPKLGEFLRFRIGKRFVSARSVTIPARPHRQPAIDDALPIVWQIANGEVDAALDAAMKVRGAEALRRNTLLSEIKYRGGTGRRS